MSNHFRRFVAAFLVAASVVAVGAGLSTAQQSPATDNLQASIFATSCADLTGEALETLENLLIDNDEGEAELRGLPSAMVVLESDSTAGISLKRMLDSPHSIVIGDPNTPVACGDIGGFIREDSDDDDTADLIIGLMPWGEDSNYSGIAEFEGDNDMEADDDEDGETEINVQVAVPNE